MSKKKSDSDSEVGLQSPTSGAKLGLRIGAVVDLYSMKKIAAEQAGISAEQLSAYVKGRNVPSLTVMARLVAPVDVSLDWLATGEGPMYRGESAQIPSATKELQSPEDAQSKLFVNLDRDLLSDMVVAVEEVLAERGLTLAPLKKGELIGILYEMEADEGQQQERHADANKRNVTRLLRLVS